MPLSSSSVDTRKRSDTLFTTEGIVSWYRDLLQHALWIIRAYLLTPERARLPKCEASYEDAMCVGGVCEMCVSGKRDMLLAQELALEEKAK